MTQKLAGSQVDALRYRVDEALVAAGDDGDASVTLVVDRRGSDEEHGTRNVDLALGRRLARELSDHYPERLAQVCGGGWCWLRRGWCVGWSAGVLG